MRKQFKPVIKHDVVTQTYTIRDEKGIVIQVPDVIIDNLDSRYKTERDTLIDDLSWYKAKVSRLERKNEEFKESHIKHITNIENYYKDRVQELKGKNGELQEVIEGKNSDLLFTEDENKQLKEDNKRLERENEKLRKANSNGWKQKDKVINKLISNIKSKNNLLSEISQHIGNKPSSSTYKYFREKLDSIGIEEEE